MPVTTPPPQLWLIEVVDEAVRGRPVQICTDERIRAGFTLRSLEIGANPCATYSMGLNYKCRGRGRQYGVSTIVNGPRDHDFIVRSSVTDIDATRTIYTRALRFRYLGGCPGGWAIGEATDQKGRRRVAAFVAGTSTPAYIPH